MATYIAAHFTLFFNKKNEKNVKIDVKCFKWFIFVLQCGAFVAVVLSDEPKQNQGRGLVDRKQVMAPSTFTAGYPKAALRFWLFGDFRCSVLLLTVILVIYKYKIGKIVVK